MNEFGTLGGGSGGRMRVDRITDAAGTGAVEIENGLVVAGVTTFSSGFSTDDEITHIGDTDTRIRFPATDTFTVETAGSERLRINSTGTVSIPSSGILDVDGHTNLDNVSIAGIVTISAGTNNEGLRITGQNNNAVIFTSPSINNSAGYRLNHHPATNVLRVDTTDQNGTFSGIVASFSSAGLDMADNIKLRLGTNQDLTLYHYGNDAYIDNADGDIIFRQGTSEKVRINSAGSIGINTTNPDMKLEVYNLSLIHI